jgi:nucleotide-binding universal stress UspA family protein
LDGTAAHGSRGLGARSASSSVAWQTRALDADHANRGIAEAQARSVRLVVLSVFEVPLDPQVDRFFGTLDDIADWEGQPIPPPPELVGLLTQARDAVEAAGLEADFRWAAGEPGRAIVDAARDARADVVVLGEHHHGFLAGLFGTDIAAEVERELGTAVIVA